MTTVNRTYKDTVFRSFFREKENFLALAACVTGETFDPSRAQENTAENILFHNYRNDVSYLIGNENFIFYEHQSTWNGNMPVRMLFYLATLYRGIVRRDLIYLEKTAMIPAPRFLAFTTGRKTSRKR